ncbi:ABC transporter permease [Actibacterium lipolyticum]|uniref:Transport permease protein n=1 Tax=Actibacterium lipolyticum TaxID=1524263 RepID=A0A238KW44_9RHOB|nr:ABC transporter permease [Actibacterium lipolyticum]SMX46927.1 Polysialic acid transport protein KpsM [Actibacterium lipolyticum]
MTPNPQVSLPTSKPRTNRRFSSFRTIAALILREMATTNGRSPGGYAWAILEPVAGIALLTAIFSAGFRSPALGTNFPLFYATGMLPFLMFVDVSGKLATSLLFSKPLLAYPTVTFLDALIARFVVNMMTHLMVAYLLLTGILVIFDTRVVPNFSIVVQGFAFAGLLAIGVGTMNCFLFTRFPVWQRMWSILTRPLFIISGIFFLPEAVPQPYREFLLYNPLVHVTGLVRRGFYASYDAPYISELYVAGVGFGLLLMGLVFLRRYHRDLLNE